MTRFLSILALLASALTVPAVAQARARDPFRDATLQSAAGQMTISQSRCPVGAQPASADCGTVQLDAKFTTPAKPRVRSTAGRAGFPVGLRISGQGTGQCSAESPSSIVTAPDGSMQFLSGASRLDPGAFTTSQIAVAGSKRGVRVAWLEPFTPGIACTYFDEPGTQLALPAVQRVASTLVSARVVKRSRFGVTVAGSQDWTGAEADGTQVSSHATWRLRLDYRR